MKPTIKTVPILPLVTEQPQILLNKKSNTYKINIPLAVEEKIRFLCDKIPNEEWSGILFYNPEGSFEKGDLVINCTDIYVMDIGTVGYTEFDMSPKVMGYMSDNLELLQCQTGLIHSHNKMSKQFIYSIA